MRTAKSVVTGYLELESGEIFEDMAVPAGLTLDDIEVRLQIIADLQQQLREITRVCLELNLDAT